MNVLRTHMAAALACCLVAAVHAQTDTAMAGPVGKSRGMLYPPRFIGGNEAMNDWLRKHVRYPKKAQEKWIEGTVRVSFVVGLDGKVTQVSIMHGCHPLLDKEALRVVGKMPAWLPAVRTDGTTAAARYTIPILFKLEGRRPGE